MDNCEDICYFQELIDKLALYWKKRGAIIWLPYDIEKGAATFNPVTFFSVLGPAPIKVAFIEPCRRPADSRYAENPSRVQHYYQYQVIIKPSPENAQQLCLDSLYSIGIDLKEHDIKFKEDDWESATLGASGVGWEVWLDSTEIIQFTYFQKMAGIELNPISLEITYGLERIAMFLQNKSSLFDIEWAKGVTYGNLFHKDMEVQFCKFNLDIADIDMHLQLFKMYKEEAERLLRLNLFYPAYDYIMKCSNTFNILDARGVLSVTERTNYILNIRNLAKKCAELYLSLEKESGLSIV